MPSWNKVKFFWDNIFGIAGGTLAATSTASGYDVGNIHNMLEVNKWKSGVTTSPQYIKIDTASVDTEANSLVILGHNLNTIGGVLGLHYSTDNFSSDINVAFSAFAPTSNGVQLKEFTSPGGKRYWRIVLSGTLSAAPEIQIAMLCNKTELDYASTSFDPHGQNAVSEVNITQGGFVSGIFTSHIERDMSLNFQDADAALYAKVKAWWEGNGMKQFLVAWENANSPDDVFLMRPEGKFNNPLTNGGAYRDININLKGRKA